jgi:hypothetical protein
MDQVKSYQYPYHLPPPFCNTFNRVSASRAALSLLARGLHCLRLEIVLIIQALNCAQRAHGNTLENVSHLMMLTLYLGKQSSDLNLSAINAC